ncbi:MAG TPA: AP2 domain-containing protein, partial [Actinophytocola sp.]|uniref:AP2 domain-containing protein n=1 Tax=Actinophytocola sp. TaxID=1872138 RepID=UPI002E0698BB|nr:AP2 domain-containing protein [Actinophytocola sp.]
AAGPWRLDRNGRRLYAVRDLSQTRHQRLHRFITGDPPHDIDHVNGDGLDNRRANLRPCSNSLNLANSRLYKGNTSGYRGVDWHKKSRRWRARIGVDDRLIHLGMFDTPEEAARAYDAAAIAAWGEYARPNFPIRTP